ncbi:hypothetical protein B0G81_0158 [Paraburkholderia sp. BL6665CI2N2]|nr:hypothetical protein B0G81_0158 [Paraburkholderia sp. BL6665CI2N2]
MQADARYTQSVEAMSRVFPPNRRGTGSRHFNESNRRIQWKRFLFP